MSKLEKRTILLNFLFNIGYVLATNFVSVYLFVYSKSLITMSIYTIIRIGLFPPFFMLGNKLSKKYNFALTYTIGIVLVTCSLVYALFGAPLFEINGNFILGAAAITGIGEGFYWYSANSCNQIVATVESRATFLSYGGIFNNISSILSPFIANYLLAHSATDMVGYRKILILIIIVYSMVIFVAFKMRLKPEQGSGTIAEALSLKDEIWREHTIGIILYGLRDSVSLTLAGILLYNATSSGQLYSQLQMVFALIAVVLFRILTKLLKPERLAQTFTIGSLLRASSAMLLVFVPNMTGAIIYGVVNAIAQVMYDNSYTFVSANIISTYKEQMSERVVARETYLSFGRCMGMVVIIVFYLLLPEQWYLVVSVTILSLMPIICCQVFLHVYKKVIKKL